MKSIYKPIGNRGFTLIEVLITVFLLVTAILGVISTTVIVIKSNSLSKEMTTATTLAKDKMEQLKNTGYNNLAGGTDTTNSIYTRTWTVTCKNGGGTVKNCTTESSQVVTKTIGVTATWPWQGLNRTVTLDTIIVER